MDEEPQFCQGVETSRREQQAVPDEQECLIQQFARDHGPALLRLAARMVGASSAEDIAQEAFVRLAKRIEEWPLHEVSELLRSPSDLRRLMSQIMACRAYELLRRRWTDWATAAGAETDHGGDPVERALRSLPPMQRIAHVLHHHCGFSDAELAATLGISKMMSRSLVYRATRALKRAMEKIY
jgi:RNA polymerase sigma factor (sigma-70 family)